VKSDLRDDPRYAEIMTYFERVHGPAVGRISSALNLSPSSDGSRVYFDGEWYERVGGTPRTRIGCIDDRGLRHVTFGPNNDALPQCSPDGSQVAFLSDRTTEGRFALYALDERTGGARALPDVPGTIEWFAWGRDGRRMLVLSAGLGADLAGAAGSGRVRTGNASDDEWLPAVETADDADVWRRLYLLDLAAGEVRLISGARDNVWEAAWCGDDNAVAVISASPGESSWYAAVLVRYDFDEQTAHTLYTSTQQIGLPAASPDGRFVAIVDACCSDRQVVAGDVHLIDREANHPRAIDTAGIDVTALQWRDATTLLCMGVRRLDVAAGEIDAVSGAFRETWSTDGSTGRRYPLFSATANGFVAVADRYEAYATIVEVRDGTQRVLHDFAHPGSEFVLARNGRRENVRWQGRDGLDIDGILLLPEGDGPFPLIVNVHGGPVWGFRNTWSLFYYFTPFFVSRGYAMLCPNPRGSSGRGQDFARMVRGDMCGEDTHDILAGVHALIDRGIADAARLIVTGGSYGGYMASWIITQSDIFAASIPVSPVTDNYSQHFTSNIAAFDQIFLDASPYQPGGRYFERSPVHQAPRAKTPALNMTGALDRCTPPGQALEFHRALLEHGVPSELVIYPQEGHGVRRIEARADQLLRMLLWIERYAPATQSNATTSSAHTVAP
jgi:dipeptidyl aminopeptidase/acylaminoacyl peptidase